MLRPYQHKAITSLYDWFERNSTGNPCLVLPTGSGKSHIIAHLCHDMLTTWPDTRVLMLTHQKELIEQNAEKLLGVWPDAPLGIYSASIGEKRLGEPITFAGIQSIRKHARLVGHVDLVVIDECHLVSHKDEGGYRKFIDDLKTINPALRVIGLTATPYRLGHGLITDEPAIFSDLIEPVSIEELIYKKFLAPLRSKLTNASLDVSGVHKRAGEYIESELQAAVNTTDNNARVVSEIIALAGERKAWLFFCTGVRHAENVCQVLTDRGIPAACVTGQTPKKERERLLSDFKAGRLRALTNANVLTTGFDYPDIDLIAMMRPTLSAGLYVQMAGRGMRVKSHADHCLVLDFAGVVATHGPITAVQPPKKAGDGNGEAPVKVCESCNELCAISAKCCSACGNPFPEPAREALELHTDDIMGMGASEMAVRSWHWRRHVSKASGKLMLACTYYGLHLSDKPITEYLPVLHDGYAGQKSMLHLFNIARSSGADLSKAMHKGQDEISWFSSEVSDILNYLAVQMSNSKPPTSIEYRLDGKFHRVLKRSWQ